MVLILAAIPAFDLVGGFLLFRFLFHLGGL